MSRATQKKFDMLDFIHGLKEHGVKEELAEYQARQLAEVIDIASAAAKKELSTHELATKVDLKQLEVDLKTDIKQLEVDLRSDIKQLEVKLEKYRYDSLRFVVWTGIGVCVFIGGLLAKGFHWGL